MYLKIAAVFGTADLGLSLEYFKPQLAEKNLNEDFCFWRIRVKERILRRIECRKRGFSSVQFSCSLMSDSLGPHEPQHDRPPCPSPTARVYPNTCSLSQ